MYLTFALLGAWIGWRRGYAVLLPLALILYIPATISFVLTNMRYTTTVQPLLLTFVAVVWWRPPIAARLDDDLGASRSRWSR